MCFNFSAFKIRHIHGNRVCQRQLCTAVKSGCTSSTSQHINDIEECKKFCINDANCEMVTFRPDGSGDCSFYKCAHCIPPSTGNGGELSVFFCGTGKDIA